jgi:hypothetical protein
MLFGDEKVFLEVVIAPKLRVITIIGTALITIFGIHWM